MAGGKKPTSLNVVTNGTWSIDGGYSPVNVNVPASAVTSGSLAIDRNGTFDVINYKNANVQVPASAVVAGTLNIGGNGTFDVTTYQWVTVSAGAIAFITLLAPSDCTNVYAINGSNRVNAVYGGSNQWLFAINVLGTWVVHVTKAYQEKTTSVYVGTANTNYNADLRFAWAVPSDGIILKSDGTYGAGVTVVESSGLTLQWNIDGKSKKWYIQNGYRSDGVSFNGVVFAGTTLEIVFCTAINYRSDIYIDETKIGTIPNDNAYRDRSFQINPSFLDNSPHSLKLLTNAGSNTGLEFKELKFF